MQLHLFRLCEVTGSESSDLRISFPRFGIQQEIRVEFPLLELGKIKVDYVTAPRA